MAYMLTIILIAMLSNGGTLSAGSVLLLLGLQFAVGGGLGLLLGWLGVRLTHIYRRLGKNGSEDDGQATAMISILLFALVFLTFTLTSMLKGNGYLAVYLCGIVIGNSKIPFRKGVSKFMDGITWLAQIVMFIMLGLLVNPHEMLTVAPVSILIGAFMIVAGRPLAVFISLAPFRGITAKSKAFVSWVGLRGAVPIIFATYPVVAGIPGASQIFNIVFFVTIVSLMVQGTTVISAAKKLQLVEDDTHDDHSFGVELADEPPRHAAARRHPGDDDSQKRQIHNPRRQAPATPRRCPAVNPGKVGNSIPLEVPDRANPSQSCAQHSDML